MMITLDSHRGGNHWSRGVFFVGGFLFRIRGLVRGRRLVVGRGVRRRGGVLLKGFGVRRTLIILRIIMFFMLSPGGRGGPLRVMIKDEMESEGLI